MKKGIAIALGAGIVLVGIISIMHQSTPATAITASATAATQTQQTPTPATSTASVMQSTNTAFASSPEYAHAHEVFPTAASDLKTALGAFTFSKTNLGNNQTKITLANGAEGYKGQSVTVVPGQKVYFVEKSRGDDSDAEDSFTKDDYLVAVDAQGNVLQ